MTKNMTMIVNMKSGLVFAALALVAAGCGKNIEYDACGQVDATQVTVSAENAGRVLSMAVEEGEEVTAGQLLGALDSVQTYLQIMELRERIAGSSSRLVDIKKQGQPNLSQLENLQNEYERYYKLLEGNATTRKQVDDLTDKIAVLKAQIAAQTQSWERGNASVRSEVQGYEIQLARLEDQLAKCRIVAPVSGTVLTRYAETGEFVTLGKPLFKVADLDQMYVRVYFSSAQLSGLKLNDTVTVIPDDGTASPKRIQGRVIWISEQSEFTPKNIQTRDERADLVYAVKVAVPNDGTLRLGMYAYVRR